MAAATFGELKCLIDNSRFTDAECALAVAAFKGNLGTESATVLHCAFSAGRRETLFALAAREDVDPNTNYAFVSMIAWAALFTKEYKWALRVFLSAFPHVNVNNRSTGSASTALHYISNKDDAELLLGNGVDVTVVNAWGATALDCALKMKRTVVADLLAQHVAWQDGVRRAWVSACAAHRMGLLLAPAPCTGMSLPWAHVLAVADDADAGSFQETSEFALVVALFL